MTPRSAQGEASVDTLGVSSFRLEQLKTKTGEFERLSNLMGHLRGLEREKQELEIKVNESVIRISYLDVEIERQIKTVEQQLLLIERSQ